MVSDLGELIARYEAAKNRVETLIDSGAESEPELIQADQALSSAFNDLLQSKLIPGQQSVQRLNYLLQLIRETQPGNRLVERLADQIWSDVQSLEFGDDDPVDTVRNGTS